jgi:hypothetical protein
LNKANFGLAFQYSPCLLIDWKKDRTLMADLQEEVEVLWTSPENI